MSAILIPLCLIKNFQTIKFLSYLVILTNALGLVCMFALVVLEKNFQRVITGHSDFFRLNSPWILTGEFFQLFQIQIFYLWML